LSFEQEQIDLLETRQYSRTDTVRLSGYNKNPLMSPTHPKTRTYFQRGLFDGLTSFRELEWRISGLATKGERDEPQEKYESGTLEKIRQTPQLTILGT
jgi:hypothetical protein